MLQGLLAEGFNGWSAAAGSITVLTAAASEQHLEIRRRTMTKRDNNQDAVKGKESNNDSKEPGRYCS